MLLHSFQEISRDEWEKLRPQSNPFLSYDFFVSLELSGSIGREAGWIPLIIKQPDGIFFSFIKTHSYGEYIFDWEWARAFQAYQLPYYPKLTSMLPFTPVTTSHFIMPELSQEIAAGLLNSYHQIYEGNELSSSHVLFLNKTEIPFFESQGYIIRESMQYHFINEGYHTFEDYLSAMKGKKAKNIRKERLFPDLEIKQFTGDALNRDHARSMYAFYLSTIDLKNSQAYLKESFFTMIFERMRSNLLYVEATLNGAPVAGTLFFYDSETIYGRYWGAFQDIQNLHFELCYYQGIDFCLKHNLKLFEAGAQGEHKITRGFKPVKTFSAHKIKNKRFEAAIAQFIEEEKSYIEEAIQNLSKQLPFKSNA